MARLYTLHSSPLNRPLRIPFLVITDCGILAGGVPRESEEASTSVEATDVTKEAFVTMNSTCYSNLR